MTLQATDAASGPDELVGLDAADCQAGEMTVEGWATPDAYRALTPIPLADLAANIKTNLARKMPVLRGVKHHGLTAVFVGGGPSAADCLEEIRALSKDPGHRIFTSGLTHRWLLANGIEPWAYIAYDPKPHMIDYLDPIMPGAMYLIGSISSPPLVDRLVTAGVRGVRFDTVLPDDASSGRDGEAVTGADLAAMVRASAKCSETALHPGGCTTMLAAIPLFSTLGFRRVKLYGVDSSYGAKLPDGTERQFAYDKTLPKQTVRVQTEDGAEFETNSQMVMQAWEFLATRDRWGGAVDIEVFGDGFLPHMNRIVPLGEYERRCRLFDGPANDQIDNDPIDFDDVTYAEIDAGVSREDFEFDVPQQPTTTEARP